MSVDLMSHGGLNKKCDFQCRTSRYGCNSRADDRLVAKLADAAQKVDATFAAVIGTPVPAVIATDYLALKRMSEKKIKLPILTVDTDGMELYDKGEEKAFAELFKTFAIEKYPVEERRIGVLGMTPQDVSDLAAADKIRALYQQKYDLQAVCYCMGDGLEEIREASSVSKISLFRRRPL